MTITREQVEFVPWPKIARLNRRVLVTEKIDGTNAAVLITYDEASDSYEVTAQSRTRLITPEQDNHGFARWVQTNTESLIADLGPGRHFGEWWGSGIQRGYGLEKGEKRFSLFNVDRFTDQKFETVGLGVVPLLMEMNGFDGTHVEALDRLRYKGSVAAPGFMRPEGIVVYSTAGNVSFKVTLEKDEAPKSVHQ